MILPEMELFSWGVRLLYAWIINMFITGIFAFSGFAFHTQKLLPKSYYNISNPKRLKKIYKAAGVPLFRTMLLATIWRSKSQQKKYFNGNRDGIYNLSEQSMKSEFGHLIPFILIMVLSIYLIAVVDLMLGMFTIVWNIVGNMYPIILQRHHRMRIEIIEKRFGR
ncbi:MAG: hypothetical protein ACI8XB_000649 [Patiriisocius sp.]|jgi:hypothetical protein